MPATAQNPANATNRDVRWWPVALLVALVGLTAASAGSGAAWVVSDAASGNVFQTAMWTEPASATQLVFTTAPQVIEDSPGTSGTITVQEQDGSGNPVGAAAAVTVSLSSGSADVTFSPGASVTIAAGSSTVSFTLSDTTDASPETVIASAAGLQSATQSEAFHAAGSHTTVSVGSQSGTLSPSGTATFSLQVDNCSGCNTHGYSLSNVGGLPAGATWSSSPSCVAISGSVPTATFTLTVSATAATPASASAYSITVTATRWSDTNDCDVSGGIYEEAEGTGSLTVNPGSAAKLAFTIQPSGGTSSGGVFPLQPRVAIEDANGNVVSATSASVTLTLRGTGTLAGCTSAVNTSGGVATFSGCAVTGAVEILNDTLAANVSGGFSSSVVSAPFNVTGAASKLAFSTEPQSDTGTGALSSQPVVSVEDSLGNVVTASVASIALTPSSKSLICLTSGTTVVASDGSATFGACAITTAGRGYTLTATSSGLSSATSSTFAATISSPTVSSPSSGSPQALAATQTLTFNVVGTNFGYGDTVADSGGDFTIDGETWLSSSQISVTVTCTSVGTDGLVLSNPDSGSVTASGSLT